MEPRMFRAKHFGSSTWVYGAYWKHLPYTPAPVQESPIPNEDYKYYIINDDFSDWMMPRKLRLTEVDPETVGQDTGFKDDKGNAVYEGDIVQTITQDNGYNGDVDPTLYETQGVVTYQHGVVFVKGKVLMDGHELSDSYVETTGYTELGNVDVIYVVGNKYDGGKA